MVYVNMRYLHLNIFLFFLFSAFKQESSPGPIYRIDSRITKTGMDGTPAYSMLGQTKDQSKLQALKYAAVSLFSTGWLIKRQKKVGIL